MCGFQTNTCPNEICNITDGPQDYQVLAFNPDTLLYGPFNIKSILLPEPLSCIQGVCPAPDGSFLIGNGSDYIPMPLEVLPPDVYLLNMSLSNPSGYLLNVTDSYSRGLVSKGWVQFQVSGTVLFDPNVTTDGWMDLSLDPDYPVDLGYELPVCTGTILNGRSRLSRSEGPFSSASSLATVQGPLSFLVHLDALKPYKQDLDVSPASLFLSCAYPLEQYPECPLSLNLLEPISYSCRIPPGVTQITFSLCGGGGGASAVPAFTGGSPYGGGGASCFLQETVNVTAGDLLTTNIGQGGRGGTDFNPDGENGQSSTLTLGSQPSFVGYFGAGASAGFPGENGFSGGGGGSSGGGNGAKGGTGIPPNAQGISLRGGSVQGNPSACNDELTFCTGGSGGPTNDSINGGYSYDKKGGLTVPCETNVSITPSPSLSSSPTETPSGSTSSSSGQSLSASESPSLSSSPKHKSVSIPRNKKVPSLLYGGGASALAEGGDALCSSTLPGNDGSLGSGGAGSLVQGGNGGDGCLFYSFQ